MRAARRARAATGAALVALALLSSACATRGTLRELGHPEFEKDVPEGQVLTLVEPHEEGQFHAYPRGAGDGDYRSETRVLVAPHVDGDKVLFDMNATPHGSTRIALLQVLVYPLAPKDVLAFRMDGTLPDRGHPATSKWTDKALPGTSTLHVDVDVPAAAVKDADQLAVPTLLRFEDGWITIVYNVVSAPHP